MNEGSQKSILMTPKDEKEMPEAELPWETCGRITQRRLISFASSRLSNRSKGKDGVVDGLCIHNKPYSVMIVSKDPIILL